MPKFKKTNPVMKITRILPAFIILLLASCQEDVTDKPQVLNVKTEIVGNEVHESVKSFPGKVKAGFQSELSFRISGPVKAVYAKAGTKVKKGEILAEIDPRDYSLQFAATEAEYNQIKNEAERVIALFNKKSVTKNEYEKALYGLEQITAKYNLHKNALEDTKLIAPYDGFVNKIHYQPKETIGAGIPVVSIIGDRNLRVEVAITAKDYLLKNNLRIFECSNELFPGKSFPLKLSGIDPKANLNQLHLIYLDVATKEGNMLLTPGMVVNVTVKQTSENNQGINVPLRAIFNREGKTCIWKFNRSDSTVTLQEVSADKIFGDGYASILWGVEPNDEVIIAGVNKIKEGQKVKPIQTPSKTNEGGIL